MIRSLVFAAFLQPGAQEAVFRSDVRLVEVYATVLESNRQFQDLKKEQFLIKDDGRPVEIRTFEGHRSPLSLAVLLDTTGSMREDLPTLKNAVNELVDQLAETDQVAVYAFANRLNVAQPFTTDKRLVKNAVLRLQAGGTTALLDAIAQSARNLQDLRGRKALVVFTDGKDNASALNAQAAVRQARRAGIPAFMVGAGDALKEKALLSAMEDIARSTGGRLFECRGRKDIDDIFREVSRDLQNTYLLAYEPPASSDGKWRTVEVSLPGFKSAKLRARQGYYSR